MPKNTKARLQITARRRFGVEYIRGLKVQLLDGGKAFELGVLGPELRATVGGFTKRPVHEIGCGMGDNTREILEALPRTTELIASDFSSEMLVEVKKKSWPRNVRFVHGSGDKMKHLKNNSVGHHISTFVVENMPDKVVKGMFEEVERTLKPGGTYVMYTMKPIWLLLVTGSIHNGNFDQRFARYRENHEVIMGIDLGTKYVRQYRPEQWYIDAAVKAGLKVIGNFTMCVPSPEILPNLPDKYRARVGWPIFWGLKLRKP